MQCRSCTSFNTVVERITKVGAQAHAFLATADPHPSQRQAARESLVFTLSTPAYWPALEYHGWLEVGHALRDYTRQGRWQEMDGLVPDEIIEAFVPAAPYDEIAELLLEQYAGVADRVLFPVPSDPADDEDARRAIEKLRAA